MACMKSTYNLAEALQDIILSSGVQKQATLYAIRRTTEEMKSY